MSKRKSIFLLVITMLIVLNSAKAQESPDSFIHLRLLETTDLHANMLAYNYTKKKRTVEFGLARTASLIKQSRKEVPNSLLFDVGDALVGNVLGEYALKSQYVNFMDIHPVFKGMNLLNYDAATLGNHEFNYGLDFLQKSLQGANFPYVNANIYVDDNNNYDGDDINYFNPYIIMKREFTDSSGKKHMIKVGVIGLITPIVAEWDKQYFQGKLKVRNIRDTAEHFIPLMKDLGADIIIVLAHTGMNADDGLKHKKGGNSVYSLSEVEGIDAILYGHSHSLFPMSGERRKRAGIDQRKGTINGVAAVQAGYWGNHLGIIDLELVKVNGKWKVKNSQSTVQSIYRTINRKKLPVVPSDKLIERVMEIDHRGALEYLNHKQE